MVGFASLLPVASYYAPQDVTAGYLSVVFLSRTCKVTHLTLKPGKSIRFATNSWSFVHDTLITSPACKRYLTDYRTCAISERMRTAYGMSVCRMEALLSLLITLLAATQCQAAGVNETGKV